MRKLIIRNIGPIKEVEFEINRINVFMGPQSSGKSTISKILCHCQWVEKACFLNEKEIENYLRPGIFYSSLVEYHKLDGYFNKTASIKYMGEYVTITYIHSSGKVTIKLQDKATYLYPKICYIPSERNFVAGVANFSKYNEGNNVLLYFGYDWSDAKQEISKLDLSKLLDRHIVYENINDRDYIYDNDRPLLLTNASSGIQSVLPLYQVVLYMLIHLYQKARVLSPEKKSLKKELLSFLQMVSMYVDDSKTPQMKKQLNTVMTIFNSLKGTEVKQINKISELSKDELSHNIYEAIRYFDRLFEYHFTQLFIEEPEQNLFPNTQQEFVYWLLENMSANEMKHSAVITTHSPYILFAINNCMMGGLVGHNISMEEKERFQSHNAWISPASVSVFELHEGTLRCIQDEDGIIEDNYLNKAYKKNSEEYLSLLNYYDEE
mgnify:CR=1 FL=1